MDDFEVYIKSNKENFKEPTLDKRVLWEKIEQQLATETKPKVIALNTVLKIAATITLFVGFGLLALLINAKQASSTSYTSEVTEIKAHYNNLISHKMAQIEDTEPLTTSEKKAYLQIISDLDIEAKDLHNELQQNINNIIVMDAIIENYKQRLQLLELLQTRTQKNKSKNNEQIILI